MSAPNCLACVHCEFANGWMGADVTPGDPMVLKCLRKRWDIDDGGMYDDMRKDILAAAENCPDFKPEEWAKGKA